MKILDLFSACFSILHLFIFWSQNTPQEGSKKYYKSWKSIKKHPPDLAWNSYLQKGRQKYENRIPCDVLTLFPRVPGTPKNITNWILNGPRNCKLWSRWALKKTSKNKSLESHQNYQNCLNLGTPGATKLQPNCNLFVTFCILGPKWARSPSGVHKESPKGSKRCQKASKR